MPSSSAMALMLHSIGRGCLRLFSSLCDRQVALQSRVLSPLKLPDLISHVIPLIDESSEAGSDAGADDAALSDQQPAALTGLTEQQPLPIDEPAPDDKAAEQVRQLPPT